MSFKQLRYSHTPHDNGNYEIGIDPRSLHCEEIIGTTGSVVSQLDSLSTMIDDDAIVSEARPKSAAEIQIS